MKGNFQRMKLSDAGAGADLPSSHEKAAPPLTLRGWLATRTPAAPPELARRLAEIVGTEAMEGAGANLLLERGVTALRSALSEPDGALDLLAADALITYAMEAATEQCATMDESASAAIDHIAQLIA